MTLSSLTAGPLAGIVSANRPFNVSGGSQFLCALTSTLAVAGFANYNDNTYAGALNVITRSELQLTAGSEQPIPGHSGGAACALDATHFLLLSTDPTAGASSGTFVRVGTVGADGTASFGPRTQTSVSNPRVVSGNTYYYPDGVVALVSLSSTTALALCQTNQRAGGDIAYFIVFTVNGNAVTFTQYTLGSVVTYYLAGSYTFLRPLDATHAVYAYGSQSGNNIFASVIDTSGNIGVPFDVGASTGYTFGTNGTISDFDGLVAFTSVSGAAVVATNYVYNAGNYIRYKAIPLAFDLTNRLVSQTGVAQTITTTIQGGNSGAYYDAAIAMNSSQLVFQWAPYNTPTTPVLYSGMYADLVTVSGTSFIANSELSIAMPNAQGRGGAAPYWVQGARLDDSHVLLYWNDFGSALPNYLQGAIVLGAPNLALTAQTLPGRLWKDRG